jgi:hypothetical protein
MALSPSTSVQGHRVGACLSPIDLISMVSYHFLAILILPKTTAIHVRERTMVQNIENGNNLPNDPWLTRISFDPCSKDQVLYGILRRVSRITTVGDIGLRPRTEGPLTSSCALSSIRFEKTQVESYEPKALWRHQARLASAYIDSRINLRISWFLTGQRLQDRSGGLRYSWRRRPLSSRWREDRIGVLDGPKLDTT